MYVTEIIPMAFLYVIVINIYVHKNYYGEQTSKTLQNHAETSAQSRNSFDANPKGGNRPLRIFLAYSKKTWKFRPSVKSKTPKNYAETSV